jgi:hypothetical protein
MKTQNDSHRPAGFVPSLLFLCAIGLAMAAVFTPWLRWSEPPIWEGGYEHISTTNLNYVLPSVNSRGNDENIGAQARDGGCAFWTELGSRLIVLGITISSFWYLIRNRARRHQILISLLLLPPVCGALVFVALCNFIVENIYLENDVALPHMIGVEWSGPGLLIGAVILFALALLLPARVASHTKNRGMQNQ